MMEAEKAHYTAMNLLVLAGKLGLGGIIHNLFEAKQEPINIAGITFKNRVGLAAGFDKNAQWIKELSWLGFSHIEVGTVTPKAQPGNDKPRLFRLKDDEALINRMGFNNLGVEHMVERLRTRNSDLIIGGNIGKNKITPNEKANDDYIYSFEKLYPWVDYFTVNVSSPNTPGLRSLQEKEPLKQLLLELYILRSKIVEEDQKTKPIFLKIAPDLTYTQLDEIIEIAIELKLDGIVATNTTLSREGLNSSPLLTQETGGLSGRPVESKSNLVISYIYNQSGGKIPIIGVGGVYTTDDYKRKLDSGASLVQVYTGFIYEGPRIVKNILG